MIEEFDEIAGFQLLARVFANGKEPNERGINEFLDQASVPSSIGVMLRM